MDNLILESKLFKSFKELDMKYDDFLSYMPEDIKDIYKTYRHKFYMTITAKKFFKLHDYLLYDHESIWEKYICYVFKKNGLMNFHGDFFHDNDMLNIESVSTCLLAVSKMNQMYHGYNQHRKASIKKLDPDEKMEFIHNIKLDPNQTFLKQITILGDLRKKLLKQNDENNV